MPHDHRPRSVCHMLIGMESLTSAKKLFDDLFSEMSKVIVGQKQVIEQMLISILCDGNVLLEGYPGLAKTLAVKTLSEIMDLKFSRIQFTPDLMPSDITGTYIVDETKGKRDFTFVPGPVFANIILADEINRATPKTQSALLEAMQEKQVTAGNKTFKLDLPFFVLATQNPIEQEGSLALDQTVFVGGELKTGKELLERVKQTLILEDKKGTKLYDINTYTFSLNPQGKLEKQKCFLYTLPYKDEMIILTTKTGKKLTVTKNHPFLVNDNGKIIWKKAEELTKQDYLVNPAKLPPIEQQNIISHQEALSKMTQRPIPKEIPFDEDFAFWIAFLLSDGSIEEKCVEAVQKNYPEALDRFVEVSKKYGFSPSIRTNRGCRYARIYSKPLVEYLQKRFGITGGKDKEIPSWFLSFTKEMNKEFLKTFISLESSLRDNRIVFTQKSKNNVNIISYMLLKEGILPWIRHDGKIFRLKIQGKDFINFLKQIGWVSLNKIKNIELDRTPSSVFRVVPIDRTKILRLVELLGLNSFHTLKNRKDLTKKSWYGSYKRIKEGGSIMSIASLKKFVTNINSEINLRKTKRFSTLLENNPREFAAGIGTPITKISEQLGISKNQVWSLYTNRNSTSTVQIQAFLQEQHQVVLEETQSILKYFQALLSEDIYYDRIKSIKYTYPEDKMAFGLTVPELQNYIAGFGGCGINHNTYPLPEAQQDRFLLKVKLDYPNFDEEIKIVDLYAGENNNPQKLKTVISKEKLLSLQKLARQVPIAHDIKKYAVNLVNLKSQKKDIIEYGASPRASLALVLTAKAKALLEGRTFVTKNDIIALSTPVLRHRIILNFEAERNNLTEDDVIKQLISKA